MVSTVRDGEWTGCTWFRGAREVQMTCTLRLPLCDQAHHIVCCPVCPEFEDGSAGDRCMASELTFPEAHDKWCAKSEKTGTCVLERLSMLLVAILGQGFWLSLPVRTECKTGSQVRAKSGRLGKTLCLDRLQ